MKECDLPKPTEKTLPLIFCFQTGESFRKTVSQRSAVTERESREEGEEEGEREHEDTKKKRRQTKTGDVKDKDGEKEGEEV